MQTSQTHRAIVDSVIRDGNEIRVHRFTVRFVCEPDSLEGNLRAAIRDFAKKTIAGRGQTLANGGDFNWGDAAVGIPNAFWKRYGILSFDGENPSVKRIVVEHDENFFDRNGG